MSRNIVIVILLIILIAAGWFITSQSSQTEYPDYTQEPTNDLILQPTPVVEEPTIEPDAPVPFSPANPPVVPETETSATEEVKVATSRYAVYNEQQALAAAQGEGKSVLFFHAAWCPTCRRLDSDISRNQDKIPENVRIFKVNYDTASDLKRKYNVRGQHTLVSIDTNGDGTFVWRGSNSLNELLAEL